MFHKELINIGLHLGNKNAGSDKSQIWSCNMRQMKVENLTKLMREGNWSTNT